MLKSIILFFFFIAIFSAAFTIGSEIEVSEEESAAFLEEFESRVADIDAVGIFTHNTSLALPMFIPGFGIAWGAFSAFSTGMAFSVLKGAYPAIENIPALTIIFMSPFGLMEIAAYSIAMSRSYILLHKIIKKNLIRSDIRITIIEIGILISLLLAGGFIEHFLIENVPTGDAQI